MTPFSQLDYFILISYAIVIIGLGYWVSRKQKGDQKDTKDYFLAGRSLVWWAIGTSCIAANISAEQLIGMTGSGFVMGLAMASYEFASAVILIFVGKYFLPIFIKKKIYTMPQFLELRFDKRVRSVMAVFWLLLYIFVNLTSILYMGGLAMNVILGFPLIYGVLILAFVAVAYSLYGGLSAVAWTDIIQVVLLVAGGIFTTWIALNLVSDGEGVIAGARHLFKTAPEKFHMVFDKSSPFYKEIPGMFGTIFGILIVANSFYWGFNQYTIQRALAAKSIAHAQHGVMLAGYLKLLMPILVVLPGIAAYAMLSDPDILGKIPNIGLYEAPSVSQADKTYPWLLGLLPNGIKGLAFAALCAAIVSSLASMINSISTIFTVDIYEQYIRKNASQNHLVNVGRLAAFLSLVIACIVAPALSTVDQAFQYIQEFTGFVSPGIVAIFLLGMFWKRMTSNAALWIAALTLPVTLSFYLGAPDIPFLNRMAYVLFISFFIGIVVSYIDKSETKGIEIEPGMFKTSGKFNIAALGIFVTLIIFYFIFW